MITKQEHNDTCKSIVDDIIKYANGLMVKCPDCGEVFKIMTGYDYDFEEKSTNEHVTCTECGRDDNGENDWEALGIYDYFEDAFDIDYLISSDKETLKGVRVLVAFGGPNIYVDTITGTVHLEWWDEHGEAWIPSEYCEQINEAFEELYHC